MTDILICEELGISTRQLRRWRDEFRLLGDDAFPGQGLSRDEEITKLRRELTKVTQERDFLKAAVAYFAKESK
jgi:transposase